MHWLDVRTDPILDFATRTVDENSCKVVEQLLGALVAEYRVPIFDRFLDGAQRGILLQEIKAVPRSEPSWKVAEISIEPADEVLAHREQHPPTAIGQCRAQLLEELRLPTPIGGVEVENLLELVEYQNPLGVRSLFGIEPFEHVGNCRLFEAWPIVDSLLPNH